MINVVIEKKKSNYGHDFFEYEIAFITVTITFNVIYYTAIKHGYSNRDRLVKNIIQTEKMSIKAKCIDEVNFKILKTVTYCELLLNYCELLLKYCELL